MFFSAASSPLLSNRCKLPTQSLWFGRADLYEDHVCIRGWTLRGQYRRRIGLDQIEEVKWWAVLDDVNFMLCLKDGENVPLQLKKRAGTWNVKLHHLLDKSMLAHHAMPNVQERETVGK